jgi:hypothetical protein
MVICASFRGETDQSVYVWIRRFESENQCEAQYKAVYEDDWWKTNIDPIWQDYHRREDIVVTRLGRNATLAYAVDSGHAPTFQQRSLGCPFPARPG